MPDYTAIMSTSFAVMLTEFVSFLCTDASGFFHTDSEKGDEHSVCDGNSECDFSTGQRVYFADTGDEIFGFDRDDESEGAVESEDEVGSEDDNMETDENDSFAENGLEKGDYQDIDVMRENVGMLLESCIVCQADFTNKQKIFENIYNGTTEVTEASAEETMQYFWALYHFHCDLENPTITTKTPVLDKDALKRWQQHRQEVSTGASS